MLEQMPVKFFESVGGREPVREWLRSLSKGERRRIGYGIRLLEIGWPRGMPLCRKIIDGNGLWEVRISLAGGKIARVLFCIHRGNMVLLHGFMKKSDKMPPGALNLATMRMRELS